MPMITDPDMPLEHYFRLKRQCKSCPWRVECDPERDIPNYNHEYHHKLCAESSGPGARSLMACHMSKDEPLACVGYIVHEVGPGNNFLLRRALALLPANIGPFEVDGEQHECIEDTLPENK